MSKDLPDFIRDHISIRWHGAMDARPRHIPATPPEPEPFNCRCESEPLKHLDVDYGANVAYDPQTYRGQRRVILVNGPANGERLVVPDDSRHGCDEIRVPYMDTGMRDRFLRYSPNAPIGVIDGASHTVLRYRFEGRPGDITDGGEYVYRYQGAN